MITAACKVVGYEIPSLIEEVNESKLDVFQEELKLLPKAQEFLDANDINVENRTDAGKEKLIPSQCGSALRPLNPSTWQRAKGLMCLPQKMARKMISLRRSWVEAATYVHRHYKWGIRSLLGSTINCMTRF